MTTKTGSTGIKLLVTRSGTGKLEDRGTTSIRGDLETGRVRTSDDLFTLIDKTELFKYPTITIHYHLTNDLRFL